MYEVRNRSRFIRSVNLETRDENGNREAVIWGPRGRDDIRKLSKEQLQSREVQKLLNKSNGLEILRR